MNPQIERNFKYHQPKGYAADFHQHIRAKAQELAVMIDNLLPSEAGREKALALTKVEEAMMWANAGIARHSDHLPEPPSRDLPKIPQPEPGHRG